MTDSDIPPSVDRLPTVAWVMAWLFLAGQTADLLALGASSSDLPWVMASMALSALVVRWFADGILRARTVRLVVAWILLSAATSLGLLGLLVSWDQAGPAALVACAFTVAQLAALGVFCSSGYFKACRRGTNVPRSALAPLLMIALATGLVGGLTAPPTQEATTTQIRVGL